jgi:hypothetical protein
MHSVVVRAAGSDEFCASCAEVGVQMDPAAIRSQFNQLDVDGGGYCRFSEFCTWSARIEAIAQGWGPGAVNTTVRTLDILPGGALEQKPRQLKAITAEAAQLEYRRKTREKRLRRDARTMRRLESSVQDLSWQTQSRRSLCCHASRSYRDMRMRGFHEPEWVSHSRDQGVEQLSAASHQTMHQASDSYMRSVAFMKVEGRDPLESAHLSETQRAKLAEEIRALSPEKDGADGSSSPSRGDPFGDMQTSGGSLDGDGQPPSLSALGRLRQAAHRVGKQATAFLPVAAKVDTTVQNSAAGEGAGEAGPQQIHVRHVGVHGWDGSTTGVGEYESEAALRGLFSRYGRFLQATVRHRVKEGKNSSWALVTMADQMAVERILASQPILAGKSLAALPPCRLLLAACRLLLAACQAQHSRTRPKASKQAR